MSNSLPEQNGQEWREAAAKRAAHLEAHCETVEAGLRTLFDERPEQSATLTRLLSEFERGAQHEKGFGAFCIGQAVSRKFLEESAFGWVRPEELGTAARLAWPEAARELKPVAQTRFGVRWTAAQKLHPATPGVLSDAVFAGASEVAQLFGDDFEFTATAAARKLQTAFGTFLALPQRSAWQSGYWLKKPAVDPPPPVPPGLLARLWARLCRLFGWPVAAPEERPLFVHKGVTLDFLPQPIPMQRTLWAGHEKHRADAARLDEDVGAWNREFANSENALAHGAKRQSKANEPIARKVSAADVTGHVRQAHRLIGELAALREKTRPHLAAS